MATIFPTSVPDKRLAASISASASAFTLNDIKGWDTNDLTASDFGTKAYGVFRNDTGTILEIFEWDPSTIASATITILLRGLKFTGDLTTEVSANKMAWVKNETIVSLGTDVPQLLKYNVQTIGTQTVSGIKTFDETTMPRLSSAHTYGAGEEEYIATKRYVDGVVTGGAADASTTTKGLVEEATQAEIDANTAAGGTLARLAINPSTLATSKYGVPNSGTLSATNKNVSQLGYQRGQEIYAADAGANDTYAITLSPVPAGYVTGMHVFFKANTRNTGAATLDVNSLGPIALKKEGTLVLTDGDIEAGSIYEVVYDGTNFQLMNPKGSVPVGSMMMFMAATAPTGYLLCDGTSYLRTDYAALFAVVGTTYGSVDGTHFTVPSLKGKVPVGVDAAQTEFDVLGETGGEKTHVLTTTEMPAHTHTVGLGNAGSDRATFGGSAAATTFNSGSAGSDGAHNNLQPYIAVNFIIKI